MSEPVRLQLSRKRGYDLQALSLATNGLAAVRVSRPGVFGNPFTLAGARDVGLNGSNDYLRQYVVEAFRQWADGSNLLWMGPDSEAARRALLDGLPKLRGKNLACWCKPGERCHADELLELARAAE